MFPNLFAAKSSRNCAVGKLFENKKRITGNCCPYSLNAKVTIIQKLANQWTVFYVVATVAFNELILLNQFISTTFTDQVIPEYVIFFFIFIFQQNPCIAIITLKYILAQKFCLALPFCYPHNPAGNYMFKVDSRTLEQGVKYVQMSLYEICLYC